MKSSERAKQEAEWRAEGDLRTFQEYCAIKKDPKRMAAVNELAKKRLNEMKSVIGDAAEESAETD